MDGFSETCRSPSELLSLILLKLLHSRMPRLSAATRALACKCKESAGIKRGEINVRILPCRF